MTAAALSACLALATARPAALEVAVAPIASIANDANERGGASGALARRLALTLGKTCANGAIRFEGSVSPGRDAPGSVAMAIAYGAETGADYVIFGFVRSGDYSLSAELRLLDVAARSVVRIFYSSDGPDEDERLYADLSVKIVDWLEISLGLPSSIRDEAPATFAVELPATVGYWTPVSSEWTALIAGTVAASLGADLVFDDGESRLGEHVTFTSLGMRLGYRYGIGDPETYEASLHSVDSLFLLRYHVRFTETHEANVALGLCFSTDIRGMTEPHAGNSSRVSGVFGCFFGLGYRFRVNDRWGITLDSGFEYRFYDEPLLSWSPRVGVTRQIFRKETKR